uniref:Wall-associated receptor kinase 2-like isoform X2 n=2 Tax=Nicotiana TaxID=4085 RepID=A0A1S3ZWD2_TOBAC|nr:PREDICTED: wall-associated receptor kinase 2-like isoform X2 [Nicotiana sylvestris]XP_016468639.1 PREDICTED: wall-associated receptor kinase 2-like isoform X2 [Nicotiana tabacum]
MKSVYILLNNSLVFLFLVLLLQQAEVSVSLSSSSSLSVVAKPGCKDKCGNLTIPYPFGIGKDCYFDKAFEINCFDDNTNHSSTWVATDYSPFPIQIFNIAMDSIRTDSSFLPVVYDKSSGKNINGDEPISGSTGQGHFHMSLSRNKFIVIGCDIYAYVKDAESGEFVSGCASFCNTNNFAVAATSSCTGNNGCCQSAISWMPKNVIVSIQTMNTMKAAWAFNNCSFCLMGSSGHNSKYISEILSSNSSNCAKELVGFGETTLEWVMGNMSCAQAMGSREYGCGNNSDCVNSSYGYRCRCSNGYQGNPYLSNGCQDINECASPNGGHCPHNTRCFNTPGSFYCKPNNGRRTLVLQLCYGISSAVILIVLIAGCLLLYRQIKNRKEVKAKQKFFKRNGGLLMQKQISMNKGSDSTFLHMKLFQKEELEKATDNFNESRILGKGGLGTVYKGMLSDGRIVAIKKSNIVDEDQVGQFVNEIFILSQINHRHIVKVLGCCLETQVPLLVYEYICNGTLSRHLHGSSPIPSESRTSTITLSLEHRLRIAREIAELWFLILDYQDWYPSKRLT